ncbi:hypothetical protein [Cellulomonas sp. KRMCY2]|uniref:hypothetical protein n=1 Tax=Cellulomonas sp. KRMCY2 TaxID=1304865 RepID=UPI00045E87F0|nr:hypothetical protein [Cellulomonas sp. KRMCY2]
MNAHRPQAPTGLPVDPHRRPPGAVARRWAVGLEAFTAVGAFAGVQGFLVGSFDSLVEQVSDTLAIVDGPVLPALALGLIVGVPHATALVLGLRHHPRAAEAGLAVGSLLTLWVVAQLPLIGWGSPVQWAFVAIGVAESAASAVWLRHSRATRTPAPVPDGPTGLG